MILNKMNLNKLNMLIVLFLVSIMVFAGGCKRVHGKLAPGSISFTPASGMVGDTVTITGKNFSTTADKNTVRFNGVAAVVTSATATQIVTTVPEGATTGKITVTVNGLTATSAGDFTVNSPPPAVISQPAFGGSYITLVGENKREMPCYWIGTERTALPIGEYSDGYAISPTEIVGATVYTAGYYYHEEMEDHLPCYWVGSTFHELPIPEDIDWCEVNDIAVFNGEVYTVGIYGNYDGGSIACYWRGTEGPFTLDTPSEEYEGWASTITVSGDTIYIGGSAWNYEDEIACYWTITGETTELVQLPAVDEYEYLDTWVTSIAVSDNTVYAAGGYGGYGDFGIPCYWTDTEAEDPEGAALFETSDIYYYREMAHSIAVEDGSVYIGTVGSYYDYDAQTDIYESAYWVDGEKTALTAPADATDDVYGAISMTVMDGTIYTGGDYRYQVGEDEYNGACYWIDETPISLKGDGFDTWILGLIWWWDLEEPV